MKHVLGSLIYHVKRQGESDVLDIPADRHLFSGSTLVLIGCDMADGEEERVVARFEDPHEFWYEVVPGPDPRLSS